LCGGGRLQNQGEWGSYTSGRMPEKGIRPHDIPTNPQRVYAGNGWAGMGDWLGTGTIAPRLREYLPYEDAWEFAKSLKLQSADQWRDFSKGEIQKLGKLPANIPANPNQTYAHKGWTTWGDWLGNGNVANYYRRYRNFRKARTFVQNLKLKNGKEWKAFCDGKMPRIGKLPPDIYASPWVGYADQGWVSMGDWLGTGIIAFSRKKFRSFHLAQTFARNLKLRSGVEWRAFCKGEMPNLGKLPSDIPANPHNTYADKGWSGMGDWLGTGTIAARLRKYRSFQQARIFARKLKLKSAKEWYAYCKGQIPKLGRIPADIPASPDQTYADKGWTDWGDWLGTGRIATHLRKYRSFQQARRFARKLKLSRAKEWYAYCKGDMPHLKRLPADIPANPRETYADKGWTGMGDWLGTGRTRVSKSAKRKS